LKTKIINLLTDLKIADIELEFILCDDAEENISMKDDLNVKNVDVKFEFSGDRKTQRERFKLSMEGFVKC
jgi:hypothetical protein